MPTNLKKRTIPNPTCVEKRARKLLEYGTTGWTLVGGHEGRTLTFTKPMAPEPERMIRGADLFDALEAANSEGSEQGMLLEDKHLTSLPVEREGRCFSPKTMAKPKAKLFGKITRAPGNEWMDDPTDPRHEEIDQEEGSEK